MESKKIGIIGNGRYGKWLGRFFLDRDCPIIVHDKNTEFSLQEAVEWADVVIFAVSSRSVIEVIKSAIPYEKADQLWMDIDSFKYAPIGAMQASKAEVVGLHPLCAPPTGETWHGETIAVCRFRLSRWTDWVEEFLRETAAKIIEVTPSNHDFLMLGDQNLVHASAIAQAAVINSFNFDKVLMLELATKLSRKQFGVIARVFSLDPALVAHIQIANPWNVDLLEKQISYLTELRRMVASKNYDALEAHISSIKEGLGDEFLKKASTFFE